MDECIEWVAKGGQSLSSLFFQAGMRELPMHWSEPSNQTQKVPAWNIYWDLTLHKLPAAQHGCPVRVQSELWWWTHSNTCVAARTLCRDIIVSSRLTAITVLQPSCVLQHIWRKFPPCALFFNTNVEILLYHVWSILFKLDKTVDSKSDVLQIKKM